MCKVKSRRVVIREGWADAGRRGYQFGPAVKINGMSWVAVVWDCTEDPDWHKADGVEDDVVLTPVVEWEAR